MTRIAIDKDIPHAEDCFSRLGELIPFDGRSLGAAQLQGVDALLVRTVSLIDRELLQNTGVRFVGTASSGQDHIDRQYLKSRGIAFASAHGCNARPVAEYVLAALAEAAEANRLIWGETAIAVIGCGAVGQWLVRLLLAMDWPIAVCDPYLDPCCGSWLADNGVPVIDLQQALSYAVISLHVALSEGGAHPSFGMIDDQAIAAMPSGVVLINASRGEVVRTESVLSAVSSKKLGYLALDVWPGEPDIDAGLLRAADLATAHIAGYSALAKRRASEALAAALAAHLGLAVDSSFSGDGVEDETAATIAPIFIGSGAGRLMPAVILGALPLQKISRQFKQQLLAESDPAGRRLIFDASRKAQLQRLEFSQFKLQASGLPPEARRQLLDLGFGLDGRAD